MSRIGHNGGPPIDLRWYQEEAVESLFDFFAANRGDNGIDRATGLPVKANPVIALPTGTGKSVVIAEFFKRALFRYPSTRGIMATHVKELVRQNATKMLQVWPHAPLGINSAGLMQRDCVQPIIFGGVKSMVKKYPMLGFRDFLVIDEGHLVSDDADTTYIKYISELQYGPDYDPSKPPTRQELERAIASPHCNPFLKVIMLTASPYRMKMGLLTNGPIATDFAYDLCTIEGFNRLMAEGFLCPLQAKKTGIEIDLKNVRIGSNGDYNQHQLEEAADKITHKALTELVQYAYHHNRKCGLIFASGIKHAEHICEMMNTIFGEHCVMVHSGNKEFPRTDAENEQALEDWKSGKAKWAVNMNSLTTGVDNPKCDMIGALRPTTSPGLWVQMLGRGTRPLFADGYDLNDFGQRWQAIYAGGKQYCLVLDFAGNTRRLGPINDPVIPKRKGEGPPGDAPVRICPTDPSKADKQGRIGCGTYNHTMAKNCTMCGYEFTFELGISGKAGTDELLRSDLPQVEVFEVFRVIYQPYETKTTGRSMVRVSYYCKGLRTFYEMITVEPKKGSDKLDYPAKKGRDWFRQRYPSEPPPTNADVLSVMSDLRMPAKIRVWVNREYPEVLSYEF